MISRLEDIGQYGKERFEIALLTLKVSKVRRDLVNADAEKIWKLSKRARCCVESYKINGQIYSIEPENDQ
jgi:hypothetical protein